MPTNDKRYLHPDPTLKPAWATDTGVDRTAPFASTWHFSDGNKLVCEQAEEVLAETLNFRFIENGEPVQEFIRLIGSDSGDVDTDLTAAEADRFIAEAEAWLDRLRAQRAQMGGQG